MAGFVKLYGTILTSSVWVESTSTRIVWITLLALADKDGFVSAAVPGLAHTANVSLADCESALRVLESPDTHSRTPEHDGRRIERVEGGWVVLNRTKYRDLQTEKQKQDADRQQKHRDASRMSHRVATESRVQSTEKDTTGYPPEFELLWKAYPKRQGGSNKAGAFRCYSGHLKNGVAFEVMFEGVKRYALKCIADASVGTRFVKDCKTFLGPDRHFLDEHAGGVSPEMQKLWSVMKTYGFAGATRFTIEQDLERARSDGKIADTVAFKRTLARLNRDALRNAKTDDDAYRIISDSLGDTAPEGLAA